MGSRNKLTAAGLALAALALALWADAEEYKIEKPPAWFEDHGAFGWECDPEIGESQECAFATEKSPGLSPPGQEALAQRFSWRTEDETESKKGRDRGTCQFYLTPLVPSGMREVLVARIKSNALGDISDAQCTVSFSPDGTLVGLSAAWADFEGEKDRHARTYTIEQFEALYWSILGLKSYKKHPEDAIRYFNHALALDPQDQRARFKLACTLALSDRTEEAIIQLAEVISLSPKKLRKKAKKERGLRSLKKEDDFKILVNKTEGWKEIRARLGRPADDALPPGLEDVKAEIERQKAEAAEAERAAAEAAAQSRSPEPVEGEQDKQKPGAKQALRGILQKVGCSASLVG